MICPVCSYENSDEGKFCSQCGAPLSGAAPTSADDATVGEEVPEQGQAAPAENDGDVAAPDDAQQRPSPDGDVAQGASPQQGEEPQPEPEAEAVPPAGESQPDEGESTDRPVDVEARPHLLDLPEIDSDSNRDAGAAPEITAAMPAASKGPVRYSTSDRDLQEARRRRNLPRAAVVFVIALALVAIAGVAYFISANAARGVEVPDVVGMSVDSARRELLSAGFQVDVTSELTEDNFGVVLAVNPSAGETLDKGSTVTITVSASRTIPDVVGMDSESALNKLEEEGAENVKVVEKSSNQPEGTVISVDPKAGSNFNPSDEITLTVAKNAKIPDVVGMQEEDAKTTLQDAGYSPEVKWRDSEEEAGKVLSMSPEAGTDANVDTVVTIYVSAPGPRDMYHLLDYFAAQPSADSEYLKWKGYSVTGSYTYTYEGEEAYSNYTSEIWEAEDGSSVSFTPVPFMVDKGLSTEDYLAEGIGFEAVRLYIPNNSSLSLGTNVSMDGVYAYMDACGFDNLKDSCTLDDVRADDGRTGKELGLSTFVCAQGETGGYVWTVLITENGAYLGCGLPIVYADMDSICDNVPINEMLT